MLVLAGLCGFRSEETRRSFSCVLRVLQGQAGLAGYFQEVFYNLICSGTNEVSVVTHMRTTSPPCLYHQRRPKRNPPNPANPAEGADSMAYEGGFVATVFPKPADLTE